MLIILSIRKQDELQTRKTWWAWTWMWTMQNKMLAIGSQLSSGDNDRFDLMNHNIISFSSKIKPRIGVTLLIKCSSGDTILIVLWPSIKWIIQIPWSDKKIKHKVKMNLTSCISQTNSSSQLLEQILETLIWLQVNGYVQKEMYNVQISIEIAIVKNRESVV